MAVMWPIAMVAWCGAALVWCDAVPTNTTYVRRSDMVSNSRLLAMDVPSRVVCAALCDRHAPDCDGFTYGNGSCRLFSGTCGKQTSNGAPEAVSHVRHPWPKTKLVTCPDGWLRVEDYCYLFVGVSVTWHEAKQRCADAQPGSRLAVIPSIHVWRALQAHFPMKYSIWDGVSDEDSEGSFQSVDGSVPWINWHRGEPNDGSHGQNCVFMRLNEMWDTSCSNRCFFICRIPRTIC